ncbi:MAG: endonuclease/exonuclease/phosphatase family protein [Alistipes sp.]
MKKLLFTGIFVAMLFACFAQKPYKVVFYNLENLFDTIRDPEIYDEEFTPNADKKWNTAKYTKKLGNIERVFFDIAAIQKDYPIVIGVSEIENRSVLEDVIAMPKLKPANYRIVHYDSPDARGVDVAFFYRPDVFKIEGSAPIRFTMPELSHFRTRDIVTMWGTIEGEPFYFMVAHWPSRLGGKEASAPKRERAAAIMRHAADSVLAINPATKIVMMGDLNDDATDKSITETLGAKGDIKKLTPGGYYNPYINLLKAGIGTLAYRDQWNLFDNIIVSENLATASTGKLRLQPVQNSKYYGSIFRAPYLFQQEGQFKGYPLRTFVGNNFQGGFSDHFPVFIYIGK